ncbi:MAG: hypothetical protein ACI4MS_01895 [Candidatus Coproplasma sp.]
MKKKIISIVNLIIAVLIALFTLSQAFAWFAEDVRKSQDKFNGSSASPYFESGDGSEGDPFILSSYNHLYNLAWLQNTGNLNDQYYYFELKNDITMPDNFWLPPIGTDEYPFQGYFDGKNKKVINLKTTTDSSKLTSAVSGSSVKYSHAVGMFGMTAAHVGILIAKITNVNLINPIVEVASQNASYDPKSVETDTVGIAIGFANCGAENIGVYNGKLSVQKTGYTTVNSIIGGYDGSKVNGDEIDSGIDIGFGGSLSFLDMMRRMNLMKNNTKATWATPTMTFNGFSTDSSSNISKYQYLPLVVSNAIASTSAKDTYYNSSTKEIIPATNIGYYLGAEAKIKPRPKSAIYTNDVYTVTLSSDGSTTQTTKIDLDSTVQTQLNSILEEDYLYGIRFNKQIDMNAWIEIADASVVNLTKVSITVPMNTVWFAAQETGMAKFIFSGESGSSLARGVTVYQLTRTGTSVANPYYTALTNPSTISNSPGYGQAYRYGNMSNVSLSMIETAYENTFDDGSVTYTYNSTASGATSSKLIYSYNWYTSTTLNIDDTIKNNGLYYTEIPIIKGCEYALGEANANGAWIIYLDIGQNAGNEGGSEVDDPKLANIDFIYDDGTNVVLITDNNFSATNVIVHFSISELTYLYFYRKGAVDNSNTLYVEYSGTKPEAKIGAGGGCDISSKTWSSEDAFIAYVYNTS